MSLVARARSLLVIADRHGSPLEFSTRRDQLSALSFCHAVALHDCAGSVTLYPEQLQLRVGNEADCYERVRIFAEDGKLVAAMSLCSDGRVRWMDALHPFP
jgi:hypothetical protein